MKLKGKLTQWNDDKGFGFVEPMNGGERAFVHIKAFSQRSRRPVEGDILIYEQHTDAKGKWSASNISLSADHRKTIKSPKATKQKRRPATFIAVLFFCNLFIFTTLVNLLPLAVMWLYLGLSVVTYLFYYLDKRAAKRDAQRTPENTLHLLSLLGGWPGAFMAQERFRHKSSKVEFRRVFWVTVVLNVAALLWLCSSAGQQLLQPLLH